MPVAWWFGGAKIRSDHSGCLTRTWLMPLPKNDAVECSERVSAMYRYCDGVCAWWAVMLLLGSVAVR